MCSFSLWDFLSCEDWSECVDNFCNADGCEGRFFPFVCFSCFEADESDASVCEVAGEEEVCVCLERVGCHEACAYSSCFPFDEDAFAWRVDDEVYFSSERVFFILEEDFCLECFYGFELCDMPCCSVKVGEE